MQARKNRVDTVSNYYVWLRAKAFPCRTFLHERHAAVGKDPSARHHNPMFGLFRKDFYFDTNYFNTKHFNMIYFDTIYLRQLLLAPMQRYQKTASPRD